MIDEVLLLHQVWADEDVHGHGEGQKILVDLSGQNPFEDYLAY